MDISHRVMIQGDQTKTAQSNEVCGFRTFGISEKKERRAADSGIGALTCGRISRKMQ